MQTKQGRAVLLLLTGLIYSFTPVPAPAPPAVNLGSSLAEVAQPLAAQEVPESGSFWSLQRTNYPPLPFNPFPGLPVYYLGYGTSFLVDDSSVDYVALAEARETEKVLRKAELQSGLREADALDAMEAEGGGMMLMAYAYPTSNALWLEISAVTNATAALVLHGSQELTAYELLSLPDLALTNWAVEQTFMGASNQDWTPLAVPVLDRTNTLFFRARSIFDDDTLPDWWEVKHFGNLNQTAEGDYDGDGVSNGGEYTNGTDPNTIAFSVRFASDYVNANSAVGTIEIRGGVPSLLAVLVNNTNFASATWVPFTSSNITASLGSSDGEYDVWVGLRGRSESSEQTWESNRIVRDTVPPTIVITNPVSGTTSRPIIQLQGYSLEPLAGIYFDVTNATGLLTNQQGFVSHQHFDTNIFEATVNDFQCFDIELTNGVNTITLRTADRAGNVTTTNVFITLDYAGDTNSPAVTLIWPPAGASIGANQFTLRGLLDDETAQVTAQIVATNGTTNVVAGLVERNGQFWVDDLPLSPGTNAVTVTATDAANNSSTTNFIVTMSDLTLAIYPVSDNFLNEANAPVSGSVSDPSYRVWVNGAPTTMDEYGNWWTTNDAPVYGKGTATFDAIAYPPGQGPATGFFRNRSRYWSSTGGQPPVVNSRTQEQPPFVYVYRYEDDWKEVDGNGDFTTGSKKSFAGKIDATGRYTYNGSLTTHGEYDPNIIEWWWTNSYNWSDANLGGSFTQTFFDSVGIWESSGPGCPWYTFYCNSVPSISLQHWDPFIGIGHYSANFTHTWDYGAAGLVTYTRTSRAFMKLRTGGRAGIARRNLFTVQGSAVEYGKPAAINWGNGPDEWVDTPMSGIAPTRIRVLGKNLGNDGLLHIALPDNQELELGASAPARHYSLSVNPTKHKLTVVANNYFLAPDRVIPGAKFVVGMKINLGPVFVPPLPEEPQKNPIMWTLAPQCINAFKVIADAGVLPLDGLEAAYDQAYGLIDFRVDQARLHQEQTFAWWLTGSTSDYETKSIKLGMGLTFANGQYVAVTAKGLLGMHQPTVMWDADYYEPGVVDGENTGPYYKVGLLNQAVFVAARSQSLVHGRFAITQLIKRTSSGVGPLGNWSNWKLDDSMPYNDTGPIAEQYYQFSGNSQLGTAADHFYDQPSVGGAPSGFLQAYSVDQFEQFFMFRPTDAAGNPLAGSIWANLGTATWNWSGSIGPTSATDYTWIWIGPSSFCHSQIISPSHQHPEFQATRPAL